MGAAPARPLGQVERHVGQYRNAQFQPEIKVSSENAHAPRRAAQTELAVELIISFVVDTQ